MNNLAAGALLLPSAIEAARRTGIQPSKLLIPVAYGSLLGGAATYFTTANIIVSDLLTIASPPQAPLGILDFTPTGGLIAIAGIAFLALFGPRLLPNRTPATGVFPDRPSGRELENLYQLDERLWEGRVQPGSPLAGKTLSQAGIGEKLGVAVAALLRGDQAIFSPSPGQVVQPGDALLLVGREERVCRLDEQGLRIGRGAEAPISARGAALIEVLLAPHSRVEGQCAQRDPDFRTRFGFTAVALRRHERSYRTDVADHRLTFGDSLLVVGPRARLRDLPARS